MNKNKIILGIAMILLLIVPVVAQTEANKVVAIQKAINDIKNSDKYKSLEFYSQERAEIVGDLAKIIQDKDSTSLVDIQNQLAPIYSRVNVAPTPTTTAGTASGPSSQIWLGGILLVLIFAGYLFHKARPQTFRDLKLKMYGWGIGPLNALLKAQTRITKKSIELDELLKILTKDNAEKIKRDLITMVNNLLEDQKKDPDSIQRRFSMNPSYVGQLRSKLNEVLNLNKQLLKALQGRFVHETKELHQLRRLDIDYNKSIANRIGILSSFKKKHPDLLSGTSEDQLKQLEAMGSQEQKAALELLYVLEDINNALVRFLEAVNAQITAIKGEEGLLRSIEGLKKNPGDVIGAIKNGLEEILAHWNDEEVLYDKLENYKLLRENKFAELQKKGLTIRQIVTTT